MTGPVKTPVVPSVDQVDEAGLDSLRMWAEDIQAGIAHADTKASILLGLSGTALALQVSQLGGGASGLADLSRLAWPHLVAALVGLGGLLLLGACVVVLILAVRPDMAGTAVCGSFVGAGQLSAEQILFLAMESRQGDAPVSVALRVALLARIATRKHARVRLATTLLLAAVGPLTLCALVGVGR
jgi:hypothetical protein